MASVLDEKLSKFFRDYGLGVGIAEDDVIKQIKRAFKDAGYSKSALASIKAKMDIMGMMTGQEWYDRFKVEFIKDETAFYNGDMLAVARRAAGIE